MLIAVLMALFGVAVVLEAAEPLVA